jgi:hypothetical protein
MSGYCGSEVLVFCTWVDPNIRVPFKVAECSGYHDRHRPSWEQMQKFAIEVSPRTLAKMAGFRRDKSEDEDGDAVVASILK